MRMQGTATRSKTSAGVLLAALALTALAWAGPALAYEITVMNPSDRRVRVEVFVISPDLSCLGLGREEIAPGGRAHWDSGGLCPGGLAGQARGQQGWAAMAETSCLGAPRDRHDWTACCRDLSFEVCPRPGGRLAFCPR